MGSGRHRGWWASAGLALASIVGAASAQAPSEPPLIDLGRRLVPYATVDRNDGSFRRMLVDPAALPAIRAGADLPEGTAIAMETFYGPQNRASVFIKEKRQGRWVYGSFSPERPDWPSARAQTFCHGCHLDAVADLTFTLPSLALVAAGGAPVRFTCPRSGRQPCEPSLYDAHGP